MSEQSKTLLLNASLAVVAVVAIIFAVSKVHRLPGRGEANAKVWFYDQRAKRLYAAPRDSISPDGDDTRVRAVVVGFDGAKNDLSALRIAYLEKYSPAFKALLERAREAHLARRPFAETIPAAGSAYAKANTFVQRPGETAWHPLASEEAAQIGTDWRAWQGPAGQDPFISVPSM